MQPRFDLGTLLRRQFVGVAALPMRLQPLQPIARVLLCPLAHAAFPARHQVQNGPHGHARPIQTHRLQSLQFMDLARLLLCLSDPMDFLIGELKLSFCHAMILHHLSSFWFIHKSRRRRCVSTDRDALKHTL
jgi:hypothetical protein